MGDNCVQQRLHPFARGARNGEYAIGARFHQFLGIMLGKLGIGLVNLVKHDEARLVLQPLAISVKLFLNDFHGLNRVLAGNVDQMHQHATTLDMAQKAVANARTIGSPGNQAGDVGGAPHPTAGAAW